MKQFLFLSAMLCVLGFSASAETHRYDMKFDEFHELKVIDGINVEYVCDPSKAGLVEFEADAKVASAIIFEPNKGKLSISLASRDSVYHDLPTVRVYSSYLSAVKNEGDSTVTVHSPAPCPKFSARLIGNGFLFVNDIKATEIGADIISGHGTIKMTGKATTLKASVTGAGEIDTTGLPALYVSATITGTGVISCNAEKKLSAGGLGTGKLLYRGTPEIKKKLLSSVKIISLDAPAE